MNVSRLLDRILPPGTGEWVERLGIEREQAERERDQAEAARRLIGLKMDSASETLRSSAPGIVLTSIGFSFGAAAEGGGLLAVGVVLFLAGLASMVSAIGRAGEQMRSADRPNPVTEAEQSEGPGASANDP